MLLLLMYLMLLWGFTKRVMYLVIVNTMVLNVMVGKSLLGGARSNVDLVLVKLAATSTIAQLKSIQMELALITALIVNSHST
jgi:hypothetical protein